MKDLWPVIDVRNLTKDFRVYRRTGDIVRELLLRRQQHEVFRALDDVSFSVARGEVLGVMGPNGAGKSTLLKMITGTLEPTSGTIALRGRVSAILELGTGFSPHKTGRENVEMGCLVLGMTPAEIRLKAEQIIEFSELEAFIDRPFHTYSSGMQARLTFAVAISPDPDVLIVDEALAVGDVRFQQKCFGRIRAMREAGTSILLVTHDDNTIATFCDRAIILLAGRLVAEGVPSDIVPEYLRRLSVQRYEETESSKAISSASVTPRQEGSLSESPQVLADTHGDGRAEIVEFGLQDAEGNRTDRLRSGEGFRFFFRFRAIKALAACSPAFAIRDRRATTLFGVSALTRGVPLQNVEEGEEVECEVIGRMWLAHGSYGLAFGVGDAETGNVITISDQSVFFDVSGPGGIFTTSVVNLEVSLRYATAPSGASLKATGR